jgi:chromosome segregation ATPase
MEERRATVRSGCSLPAEYAFSDSPIGHHGRITNLSVKGLGLLARQINGQGSPVRVHFTLPSEEQPLAVNGIIRWRQDHASKHGLSSVGIEFVEPDDTTRFCLQAFVAGQVQQAKSAGQSRRIVSERPSGISSRVVTASGLLMAGLVVSGLLFWILMMRREMDALSQRLAERTTLATQLEARRGQLEETLRQSQAQAAVAVAEIERLQRQTAQLEEHIQWLSQNLGELTQAYQRVRDEREQLHQQIVQLEEQHKRFEERLGSVPELRSAMRQAIRAQQGLLRRERAQRIERLRERDHATLQQGNRGYVMQSGQSTLTSTRLSIRVHELTSPASP